MKWLVGHKQLVWPLAWFSWLVSLSVFVSFSNKNKWAPQFIFHFQQSKSRKSVFFFDWSKDPEKKCNRTTDSIWRKAVKLFLLNWLIAGNSSLWLIYYTTHALQRKGSLHSQQTYRVLNFFGHFSFFPFFSVDQCKCSLFILHFFLQ